MSDVALFSGDALGQYGFGNGHPFSTRRLDAFLAEVEKANLKDKVRWEAPVMATRAEIERFHRAEYIERVIEQSLGGEGYLDHGDTPAFPRVYEAAATVVGSTLAALRLVMSNRVRRAFVPIAGLHHARRDGAAGFCVFNDCGAAIECLKAEYPSARVAYVDIDAHHGDGVYYAYADDASVGFVDLHEDGRYLYPGTGAAHETGTGNAKDTKLNVPLLPESDDRVFEKVWPQVEEYLDGFKPNLILLQCGADSIAGDPLTHMRFSPAIHRRAASRLCAIANRYGSGKVVALGGGGYNLKNVGLGWAGVVSALIEAS